MPLIVPDVLGQDAAEVPLAEDQHVVQVLAAQYQDLRVLGGVTARQERQPVA